MSRSISTALCVAFLTAAVFCQMPKILVLDLDRTLDDATPNPNSSAPVIKALLSQLGYSDVSTQTVTMNDHATLANIDYSPYNGVFVCNGVNQLFLFSHVFTAAEGQRLVAYLSQGGRVYMEGGDVWYSDPTNNSAFNFLSAFKLTSAGPAMDTLYKINGLSGNAISDSMLFDVDPDCDGFRDLIAPGSGASKCLENRSKSAVPTVSNVVVTYSGTTYRTIASALRFSGLVDGGGVSTKLDLLGKYLKFLGLGLPCAGPAPVISGPAAVCAGGSVTLDAGAGYASYLWSTGATTRTVTFSPAATASYTVTVTDAAGCSGTSAAHAVVVNPLPAPTVSGPTSAAAGSSGHVYSTETGMNGYVWTVSAGGSITSGGTSTDSSATVTWAVAGEQTVGVSYADGSGCAGTSAPYPVTVTAPVAGCGPDFNGDGKTDILWRSGSTGELYAWYMDGAAKLDTVSLGTVADQGWRVVGSGDFNSDGSTDILWRNGSTGGNYAWFMDGSTQVGGGPLDGVPDAAWDVAGVADFDADGKPDILWRNSSAGENYLWFMDGLVQKGSAPVEAVADLNWGVAGVGDFNADGKPDIFWRNAATGENYAWFMEGALHAGGAFLDAVADPAWFVAWVGDYDGDGDADVLWRNSATGDNVLWTMSGVVRELATYLDAVADQAWRMWDVSAAAAPVPGVPSDFDLDGKADVLWRNATTGDLYVWTMDGVVRKGAGAPIGAVADANWKVAGMADFNSDGRTDVLWRNYNTGENFVWYMNGLVQNGGADVEAVGDTSWLAVGTGDFNSDGKPDILWRNAASGDNYAWYMDGATHSGGAPLDAVADIGWNVAGAADFTGDGKPDILWRNAETGQVYIWTMDGVVKTGGVDLGIVPLDWEIAWTADYSGDGKADILWRNTSTGENYVWYIVGSAREGGAPMEAVPDQSWAIMPQM